MVSITAATKGYNSSSLTKKKKKTSRKEITLSSRRHTPWLLKFPCVAGRERVTEAQVSVVSTSAAATTRKWRQAMTSCRVCDVITQTSRNENDDVVNTPIREPFQAPYSRNCQVSWLTQAQSTMTFVPIHKDYIRAVNTAKPDVKRVTVSTPGGDQRL